MTTWKDDIDYPDYFQISDDGQVYSKRTSKILKTGISKTGYVILSSRIGGRTGKAICLRIHRMVAKSFIPNPDNKPEVNHKDGNKTNNCVSNLEWVTSSENTKHAYDNALKKQIKGEKNPLSKFDYETIKLIRKDYQENGITQLELANKYNCSKVTIHYIVTNKKYN